MNLVRVFVAIYETRSLTLAADRLYVTQSAVSQSLARLRRQFDDSLFERSGAGMSPTPLAEHIFPRLRDATVGIDSVLIDVNGFDPSSTSRRFRIALSELGEIGWLPGISSAMSSAAPLAQIEVVPLDPALLPDWLNRGMIDVAITPVGLGGKFPSSVAKWEGYGVAMSTSNPFAEVAPTAEDYLSASRAVVMSDSAAPILEAAEFRAGVRTEPAVLLQHYATLPPLLISRPSLIAAVPTTVAERWAHGWPLTIKPLPIPMEEVQIRVYRRATTQQPAALDWFYRLVCSVVSSTTGSFDTIQGHNTHSW